MSNSTSNKIRSTGELIEFLADASISPRSRPYVPTTARCSSLSMASHLRLPTPTPGSSCATPRSPAHAWASAPSRISAHRRRMARGLSRIRREAIAHPQQRGGAHAPRGKGLPRINRLTDIYNSLSVTYGSPSAANLNAYVSSPQLVRATGAENFATMDKGEPVTEHPRPGWSGSMRTASPAAVGINAPVHPHGAARLHHRGAVHPRCTGACRRRRAARCG